MIKTDTVLTQCDTFLDLEFQDLCKYCKNKNTGA